MLKIKFILSSIFCLFVLLQADAQDLPSANVWGNTRVHLRTQNGDSSGYAPISSVVTWNNTTSKPSFAYSLNQILYGTGSGQTSSSNLTTDGTNLFLNGGVLRGLGTPSLSTDAVPLSYFTWSNLSGRPSTANQIHYGDGLQSSNFTFNGSSIYLNGNASIYRGDAADLILSYNSSASNALQFRLQHDFSYINLTNTRGGMRFIGTDSFTFNKNVHVSARLTGGFGADGTGGALDWNDITNARPGSGKTLLLGNATNGFGEAGNYYHPFSFEYSSKDGSGNMTQFAIPYIAGDLRYRTRYNGTWNSWQKILSETNADAKYLNASNLTSGILPDARLSSNVPLENASNNFTTINTFSKANNTTGIGNGANIIIQNTSGAAFNERAEIHFKNVSQITSAISSKYSNYSAGEYGGDLIFATKNYTDASIVERLRIASTGNIDILSNNQLRFYRSDNIAYHYVGYSGTDDLKLNNNNGGSIIFGSNLISEFGRWDLNGKFGIGITSPFSKFQTVQNSSSGGYSGALTSAQHGLYIGTSSVLSTDYILNVVGGVSNISSGAGGTSYFSIRANGTTAFVSTVQVGDATTATHAMNRQSSDARYLGLTATATNSSLFRGLDTTVFAQRNQVNTFTQRNNFTNFVSITGASAIAAADHINYTDGTDRIYTMQGDGNVRSSTYQALINANQANDTFAMTTAAQTFTLSSNLVNTVDVGLHASTFDSLDIRLPATMFDDNQTISITTSNKRMIIGQGDKIKITSSTGVTLLQIINDTNSTLSEKYEINSAVLGYISMQIQYSKKRNLWRIVSFNNWVDQ